MSHVMTKAAKSTFDPQFCSKKMLKQKIISPAVAGETEEILLQEPRDRDGLGACGPWLHKPVSRRLSTNLRFLHPSSPTKSKLNL